MFVSSKSRKRYLIRGSSFFGVDCLEFYLCRFHWTETFYLRALIKLIISIASTMIKNLLFIFSFLLRGVIKSLPILNSKFNLILIEFNLPLPQHSLILSFHYFFGN